MCVSEKESVCSLCEKKKKAVDDDDTSNSLCVFDCVIPLPSGSSRSGVTVAVMSGQTAYAEITSAPKTEAKGKLKHTCTHTYTHMYTHMYTQ